MPSPLRRTHGAHLGNVGHHLMKRPLGRSPKKPVVWHHDFKYQAKTWDQSRRAVAPGWAISRVGFVVTNLSLPGEGVTHFYNGRARPSSGSRGQVRPELDAALVAQVHS